MQRRLELAGQTEQSLLEALKTERRFLVRQEIFKQIWRLQQQQQAAADDAAKKKAAREAAKPARSGRAAGGEQPPSYSARSA